MGLYFRDIAQKLGGKRDLHEPNRPLSDLGPYEHLRRIFRLCVVHGKRNIRACGVPDDVRNDMRSLYCVQHPDWDEAIRRIKNLGGKSGAGEYHPQLVFHQVIRVLSTAVALLALDWLQDKVNSSFAFPAMCWEKSFIPLAIWRSGEANSNLIESVHADVYCEGVSCTLVGGIIKGRAFDLLKTRTLHIQETVGIRPSYDSGHITENEAKSLKRKSE